LLLAPFNAAAAPPLSRGGEIEVIPARHEIELGLDREVALRIHSQARLESVALLASCGKVEQVEQVKARPGDSASWWRGRYVLPERYYPQVAIILAVGRRAGRPVFGWTALRLLGMGDAVVETRPRARISIKIGEETFGPVYANRRGVARVPVRRIRPGVIHGWDGKKRVSLNLPPVRRLLGWLDRRRVDGARGAELELFVVAVAPDGAAHGGPAPRVQLDGRPTGSSRPAAGGGWRFGVPVPAGRAARLRLEVSLPDAPGSQLAFDIERTAPPEVAAATRPVEPVQPVAVVKKERRRGLRPVYFWTSVGVTAAVLATGVTTRLVALSMSDEYKDEATTIARRREIRPTGQSLTTFSSAALGVGAALAVGTGVLYWLTDFDGRAAPTAAVSGDGAVLVGVSGGF
jgi:hypothetical protein